MEVNIIYSSYSSIVGSTYRNSSDVESELNEMGKLVFMHYMKYTREFLKSSQEVRDREFGKYSSVAEKHGLKVLSSGSPWGNEYHALIILESEKGMEAWDAYTTELLKNWTPDAWEYIKESRTEIMSPV